MSAHAPIREVRRFGIFEFDLVRRELLRNGLRIKLRDQSFLLLAALLEQPGELVTREELRGRLWPDGTFVDFDHSLNAAIKRLRDALGDDPDNPRFIETVPKRGYRFLAPVEYPFVKKPNATVTQVTVASPGTRFHRPVFACIFLLVIICGLAATLYISSSRTQRPTSPMKTIPLTTYPGAESGAAFSNDGEEVAFLWDRTPNGTDVYVKRIGTEIPLKVTHGDGPVCCPAWTSDNRYIGFEHCSNDKQGIYLVSSLGGPERKLKDTGCNGMSFSPNDQIVFSERATSGSPYKLFFMSLDDPQPHQLTSPPADTIGDFSPAYSADGKTVAFVRLVGEGNADLYLVSASGGTARRLTFDKTYIFGVAWTADSKVLVFSSHRGGGLSLWFVPAVGGIPKRLPLGGAAATDPAISHQGNRLTYTQGDIHPNLWSIDIWGVAGNRTQAKPFLSSAAYNNAPRFSPNGKKVAFASPRSGEMEIWTCDAPGCAEPQQLTFLKSLSGTPRWSPDGKSISFESRPNGHSQIFVVNAEGGRPRPITEGTAEDKVSSWSSDGKFIYFASNRSGESEIWKTPSDGGRASRVTYHGGFASWESSDGRFLYYVKGDQPGIWRMSATGGDENKVLAEFPSGRWGDWALVDRGIYYADESGARPAIKFLNFADQKVSKIAEVEGLPPFGDPGFTVSPDEKQLVFSQIDRSAVDLMLVENFSVEP